jgi:hypothetical protein
MTARKAIKEGRGRIGDDMLVPGAVADIENEIEGWRVDKTQLMAGVTAERFRDIVTMTAMIIRLRGGTDGVIPELINTGVASREVLDRVINSSQFIVWLKRLGHNWEQRQIQRLTVKQVVLIESLTDPNDKRTFAQKIKAASVTNEEYARWIRIPIFKQYIEEFAESALTNHKTNAIMSLVNQVDRGDMNAIKYYFAMTGRYDPDSRSERDIRDVVIQVIDIITRNVTNPSELQAISGELYNILEGNNEKCSSQPTIRGRVDSSSGYTNIYSNTDYSSDYDRDTGGSLQGRAVARNVKPPVFKLPAEGFKIT